MLLHEAALELADIAKELQPDDASRGDIDRLVAKLRRVEARAFGPRPRAKKGQGAKWQILAYLREHVGTTVAFVVAIAFELGLTAPEVAVLTRHATRRAR